ncbi:hypothetical protein [Ferrovibrio sp.]|uniref:hypothetical protein n=1 Tax=Ferrovibrio sp. TaxID=1917215 RepID=UPI000CCA318A|nr:hypothetical protein [Ferrovibrio sp.]PJI37494.1 MAG: hypothetical protein CTR53_20255 [Ferrovibrio sp.]
MALPSSAEITAAVKGLGLLLRGDARALLCYDLSLDGFWRSFWLPLVLLVVYALVMQPTMAELAAYDEDRAFYMLAQGLKFLLNWVAYFALIAGISRIFGLGERFGIFVILYNWAQAITTAATLPILAGVGWGLLSSSVLAGWSTALLLAWLYIVVRVARHGLGATLSLSVAISALDLLVTLAIHRLVDLLL